jgi:type II secretory pathway component GspD/PulD (secretin)
MIKKIIFAFCFLASLMFSVNAQDAFLELSPPNAEVTISMDFKDAGLKDILKVFSMQSGLNFIASQAVEDRKITLYLDKVSVNEAMDNLFKANNLSYELDADSKIIIVKDWGIPSIETITRVFNLKYHSVPSSSIKQEIKSNLGGESEKGDIMSSIKEILSDKGKITEDRLTNSLIVTDIPSRFPIIEETIKRLDVSSPQVMLEVEMLDVSKNLVDKIGIKFGSSSAPSIFTMVLTGAKRTTKFPFSAWSGGDKTSGAGTITGGNIDFSSASYTVLLDFFKSQADTRYLARPRILTLNNETAEIKIVTKEAIGSLTTTQGQGSSSLTTVTAERIETGVSLRVTPQINTETGEVTMFIVPAVKDTSTSTWNASFKDPEERSTKSVVRVKDGETVIIGGLIRNDSSQTITKFPILGDVPILGAFFRHKDKDKDRERELLVFITPHIIKEQPTQLARSEKISLLEREQATESAVDRQKLINGLLNNFDQNKKK